MSNMRIYDLAKDTPSEAKKPITGGRLKGMTDINPQYRIRKLTELFGPCGVGWYYTTDNKWTVQAGEEILCFVDISLYYKDSGEWSKPVPGSGGSTLLAKERNGIYADDEAYKKATTDAIGVACKQIGIGADVYWAKGESKYNKPEDPAPEEKPMTRGQMFDALATLYNKDSKYLVDILKHLQDTDKIPKKSSAKMTNEEYEDTLKAIEDVLRSEAV